jgi:signal peptidase I
MRAIVAGLALALSSESTLAGVEKFNPPVPAKAEHARTAERFAQRLDGSVMRVANTRSMEPMITAEDLLILKPAHLSELKIGDIVIFKRRRSGGILIGHRVIRTESTFVQTKGDNLRKKDADLVTQDMLLGRVELLVNGQTGEVRDPRCTTSECPSSYVTSKIDSHSTDDSAPTQ